MREDAHTYFLNAKARFQNSEDNNDAADLYFAANNLSNHGHEVEWDETLQKMEAILKKANPELMYPAQSPSGIHEVPLEAALQIAWKYPALNTALLQSPMGRAFYPGDESERFRDIPWTHFGKWRSHQAGDDRRRVYVKPVCSDFPGGAFDQIVNKRVDPPDGVGPKIREYEQKVRAMQHPLAHKDNIEAIRELRASRPMPIEDPTRPDEMAIQNWFIETTRHPKVYDHLLDYYHPDSPFFVKSETHGDRRFDAHMDKVIRDHLPRTTKHAEKTHPGSSIENLVEMGEAIFDVSDKNSPEVEEDKERLDHMRDEVGIFSSDVIGTWDKQMRSRLYEARFLKWLQEYNEHFPESTLPMADRRKVFLDHLMLDIDGVAQPLGWQMLYDDKGSPRYQLPEPGQSNPKAGYKQVAWSPQYDNWRVRKKALGLEALRSGLICVPARQVDRMLLGDQQMKFLKALQRMPKDSKGYLLGEHYMRGNRLSDELAEEVLSALVDEDGNEWNYDPEHTFIDGSRAPPIPYRSLNAYMQAHKLVMNTAMAKFMINSIDTPHEADQPIIYPKESNLVKECLRHMLRVADWQRYGFRAEGKVGEETAKEGATAEESYRLASRRTPIYTKFRNADYEWDTVYDIPKVPMETFKDLTDFIEEARVKKIIGPNDRHKMLVYSDSAFDGSRALSIKQGRRERDFSSKRKAQNLRTASPFLDSVWGIPLEERNALTLEAKHEATPFAPTHKRLTRDGGLGYHAQDPNSVFGQWAVHEMIPIRPEMLGIHDYRPIPQPGDEEYVEFLKGLGFDAESGEWLLGDEIHEYNQGGYSKDDIRYNAGGKFPRLQERLFEMYQSFRSGPETWSEADLARQDAEGGSHKDKRGDQEKWNATTAEDIIRNTVIRHTQRLFLEEGEGGVPKSNIPDSIRRASLRELVRQQLPDEVAEGSLGYLPIGPAHFAEYATTIPPWVAVNIILEEHIRPRDLRLDRSLPPKEAYNQRIKGMIVAQQEHYKNIPPPRGPRGAKPGPKTQEDYVYSDAFHPYWQGVVLNMASMFYIGRNHSLRNSTLYPHLAAQTALNNEHGHGIKFLEEGDGSGNSQTGHKSLSFNHRQLMKPRVLQNEALLKDFEAKHAASIWGLGGAEPITDLEGNTVISAHLGESPFIPRDSPYLDMIKRLGKRNTLHVHGKYLEHPTPYTPSRKMNDLYAVLASKRGGRRYDPMRGTWVEDQPIGIQPNWKDALESPHLANVYEQIPNDETGEMEDDLSKPLVGPHWYPLEPFGDAWGLRLKDLGLNMSGAGEGETPIHAPTNFLHETPTQPVAGGMKNMQLQQRREGIHTFDISTLAPGWLTDDGRRTPAFAEDEDERSVPYSSHARICQNCLGPDGHPTGIKDGSTCPSCHGSRRIGWTEGEADPETEQRRFEPTQELERDPETGRPTELGRSPDRLYYLLHSGFVPIDPEIVTTHTDVKGDKWALGPHPAAFAAQWVEHVMSKAPQSTNMRNAIDVVNGMAKKRFDVDVPEHRMQDIIDPDIMYRSGASPAGHHLMVRNHMNVAHGLRVAWPIVTAEAALRDARARPEDYEGTSFKEKLEKYEKDALRISPDEPYADIRIKRARIYMHLKQAYGFLSGHNHKTNTATVKDLWSAISNDGDDGLADEWKDILGKAGIEIGDKAWKYKEYNTHSPIGKYKTEVYSGSTEHPLAYFSQVEHRKEVMGYEILQNYLGTGPSSPHAKVRQVLDGHYPNCTEDINREIEQLVRKFPLDDYPKQSTGNIPDIEAAGQHPKGQHSDDWFDGLKDKSVHIDPTRGREKRGFSQFGDFYGTTKYADRLYDRGRHARRALAAEAWAREQMSGRGANALWNKFGLLHTGRGETTPLGQQGLPALSTILQDLSSMKDKKTARAFPDHHNALSEYANAQNATDKMGALMKFLFTSGDYTDVHSGGNTTTISGGQNPRVGYHHGELSSVPSTVDFSRAKLSSHLFNHTTLKQFGVEAPLSEYQGPTTTENNRFLEFHPDVLNGVLGYPLDQSDGNDPNNFEKVPAAQDIAAGADVISASMDALTDTDLLFKAGKGEGGKPVPVKAMHRVFSLKDLDFFKGLSGDWVVSSWPIGERLMVTRKSNLVKARDGKNEDFSLSNEVKKDVRAAFSKNFVVDCLWDGDVLHMLDILESGSEDMETDTTKDRIRHLRANFAATENVSIPAPINTKRVDSEGLKRAVSDLYKEKGVKQIMLRDADSTYMGGEIRHPKWLLLTKEHLVDVIVLEVGGASSLLGIGPILEDDAKKMGNRSVKYKGQHYMDVGSIVKSDLSQGQFITVKTSNVVSKARNNLKIFTLHGIKYVRESEAHAADSLQTLELLSGETNRNVPHKMRVRKGSVHLEFPIGHVVYDTESFGHSFLIKSIDAPNGYMFSLAESQREYWEPLAAVFLRAEVESKKSKKEAVVPEPPANHDKKPKKVLKPEERILKDPKVTKQLVVALEVLDGILKEKITWTGPKGLGIDYATPVESPSGPTELTEPKNLPDHDPAHRQEKGGDCWCGAKKGQECEQGLANKMEDCPKFSPPKKEEDKKHLKISVS